VAIHSLLFKFSSSQSNFEDFLSVGKETTPTVPVPITSEKIMKKLIKRGGWGNLEHRSGKNIIELLSL
jgi:hypothetical protein